MSDKQPVTTTVFIELKMQETLGAITGSSAPQQVPLTSMGGGVIGAMLVYRKIPKGRSLTEFMEAEV